MAEIIKHHLDIEIPDTPCETIIRILDSSSYSEIDRECVTLQVLVPGYEEPVEFENMDQDWGGVILNAVDLNIQQPFPQELSCLPDGIYVIQYSVSPNDIMFVKKYHLRTTILVNKYYKELCRLQLDKCEPVSEQNQKLNDLRYIKSLIDAAKAKAEVCDATQQALDMYHYATILLDKYINGCCVTCK